MADWKLLGEVPDSEDEEALDSQELTAFGTTTTTTNDAIPETTKRDIWDFPDSDEEIGNAQKTYTPKPAPSPHGSLSSSPLSSAQSVDGLPELDHMLLDHGDDESTQEASKSRQSTQNSSRIYIELGNRPPGAFDDMPRDRSSPPPAEVDVERQIAMASQELGAMDDADQIQREAVRLERSLRPRKPIQEHPYLLENAHYSSLFRKHGVRPVQMAIARARAARDEAVQEDDEFHDDSQGNSLPDFSNSSQPLNSNEVDNGDLDMFNLPSSSPPKTSPWISHGRSSNHASSQGDTDNTSIPDQDLPALHELLAKTGRKTSSSSKRASMGSESSARKRRRRDIIESDPVEGDGIEKDNQRPSTTFAGALPPIPRLQMNARQSADTSPTKTVLAISNSSSEDERDQAEEPRTRQGGVSDEPRNEGLDYMNRIGRRIKGVLPASWLRLDQKTARDKAKKDLNSRDRNRLPEQEVRRGVAQPRTTSKTTTSSNLANRPWFFDDSDEEPAPQPPTTTVTTDDTYHNQARLLLIPDETPTVPIDDFSDDGSVIEHDTIDTMGGGYGGQTQRRASDAPRRPKSGSSSVKRSNPKPRQQKITSSLSRTKSVSSGPPKQRRAHGQSNKTSSSKRQRSVAKPLSVLDVIEPDAPRFLRIAARTARRKVNQGRSSPSCKVIRLASRNDHVDALSSLNDWKAGAIPQRPEVSAARREKRKQVKRRPLVASAGNRAPAPRKAPKQPRAPTNQSRRFVKQTSNGGSARYLPSTNPADAVAPANIVQIGEDDTAEPAEQQARNERTLQHTSTDSSRPSRPAVLEAEDLSKVAPLAFHRSKKFLDRIYRRNNRESSVDTADARSELSLDRLSSANLSRIDRDDAADDTLPAAPVKRRTKTRKARKPMHLDIDAPQFSHATDPLPAPYEVEVEAERPQSANTNAKLTGLGPYGTQYTTHFEIFPLDPGVYFHESTLLGSGIIEKCQDASRTQELLNPRPRVSLQFGAHSFRWGEWNDQTSSELGIVLDFIADELENPDTVNAPGDSRCVEAAQFISKYATTALNFANEAGVKSFVARVLDVSRSCHSRLSAVVSNKTGPDGACETAATVYNHLNILSFTALMVCNGDNNLMAEKFQAEDLLRSLASGLMSVLVLLGTYQLKDTYARLQSNRVRERGLRDDRPAIHSWALVMQILEASHIPRGSFWDVLKQTIATNDKVSTSDAQVYERIWDTIFTILPICEFSPSGILVPGKRFQSMSDGWMIVQLLLRQVFALYRENTRQAPSFNNYCRALISRCHYLVQQWGWRRSGSVVGAIFDFFGSQNLEHLRNEEVNASPKFLEQLAGEPSLAVEPEDKCFHIFLKLLALSIQKLRAADAVKDIRNLVARTIPNHNRQHLKEQTVHERDLAALRNHHDLLATLFWVAPADLRPSATLLERLVAPETSHKEASLINIRCWNQLSRFIVAKGEASTAFKLFQLWRNGFFQKMVQQFDSAAADIQQQLMALPKESRHEITEDIISSMVSMNKGAASDVLHACIGASLDVMKHAADLESATFCLNTLQLQHIYKQFAIHPPELNWSTLRAAISTLEIFLSRIAEFKENEESQQSESQILNSAQADDSLLLLDHEISKSYFSMVRCTLSNSSASVGSIKAVPDGFRGIEQGITVAVRLAASFINGGLIRLHDLFKRGKYGLFDGPIHKLDLERRRFLPLVVVILLKAGIDDFSEANFTLCELWLLLLIRPNGYLAYENQLAEALRLRGEYFVPATDTGLTQAPTYDSNSTLFEFAISAMRRSIRDAGPSLKKDLIAEHSKALKLAMEQMKDDLRATSSQPVTHVPYVAFARQIISLIRTHGAEICSLDNFYYQISKDYSPSTEDPQLQVAAMVSYGLRLREGDAKVVQQVFFFLFNNFKMAVVSDRLNEEKKMLCKGMAEDIGITRFVLGKMLPAIIGAAVLKPVAYPLLDLYALVAAKRLRLAATTYSLADADLQAVKAVLQAIVAGLQGWILEQLPLTAVRLHTLQSLFSTGNSLWPSLYERALNETTPAGPWSDVISLCTMLSSYAAAATSVLDSEGFRSSQIRIDEIFAAAPPSMQDMTTTDRDVAGFADNIKQDIDRNWIEVDGRIAIQTPGKPRAGGEAQGVAQAKWDAAALMAGTMRQLAEWQRWQKKLEGGYTVKGGEAETIMF